MRKLKFRAWDTILNKWNLSIEISCLGELQEYKYNGHTYSAKYADEYNADEYSDPLKNANTRFVICHWTGLYDRHGIEIYEGDILQYKHYYVGIKWWSTVDEIPKIKERTEEGRKNYQIHKERVYFQDGAFKISGLYFHEIITRDNKLEDIIKTGQTHSCDFEQKYWDFEVVGNIYQNPELLNYEL